MLKEMTAIPEKSFFSSGSNVEIFGGAINGYLIIFRNTFIAQQNIHCYQINHKKMQ